MLLGRALALLVVVCGIVLGTSEEAVAQRYRYIDGSGNIHFVDSLSQVPERYITQVVPATPTPVYDRRALQEKRRQEQMAAREAAAQKNREQAEARRREVLRRQEELKEQRRLQREQQMSSFTRSK
jgi:hypothetical protein